MNAESILQKIEYYATYPIFTINQTPVSFFSVVAFVLVFVLFLIAAKILKSKILGKVLNKFNIEEGIQFTLLRISHYIILFIGTVVAFQVIGIDLSSLAVVLGFLSVGIGFGLQNVASNFISGLILLFERPIKVGDRVTVGDAEGDVININMRSTTIRTLNNITIIVPNSTFISDNVINWSHGDKKVRLDLEIGVSYDSDLDLVIKALKEVARENREVLRKPATEVHLRSFGDSAWNMQLHVWIPNPKRLYNIESDLNKAIVSKFRQYNIEIPFPQRDLHIRSGNSTLADNPEN